MKSINKEKFREWHNIELPPLNDDDEFYYNKTIEERTDYLYQKLKLILQFIYMQSDCNKHVLREILNLENKLENK